jgi:hypothetical protein
MSQLSRLGVISAAHRRVVVVGCSNTFDGSNGVAITTANSGGALGRAFDSVSATAAQVLQYDTTVGAHGTGSGKFQSGATAGQVYVSWSAASAGSGTTTYGRVYLYRDTANTVYQVFFRAYNAATSRISVGVNAAGYIQVLDATNTAIATASSNVMPVAAWVRVEWSLTLDAVSGAVTINYYALPEATTPTYTLTATAANFGGVATDYRLGMCSTIASSTVYHLDEAVLNTTGFPGPF